MGDFVRDPSDWLRRHSPDEWIRAGLGELARAESAFARGDARSGATGIKRAAGMALNAALIVEPDPRWGKTYVEHVKALAADERVPQAVRHACRMVLDVRAPAGDVVSLRTPRANTVAFEAARDIIAHAWAVVRRSERVE